MRRNVEEKNVPEHNDAAAPMVPGDIDQKVYPKRIIWKNVILLSSLHVISLVAILRIMHYKSFTLMFGIGTYVLAGLGVTAGAHRLWTHRSYKAKLPLRIVLMLWNSLALQNSIFDWSRDHRTHHKYSETNADPHNATRGFFFSHVGWLLVRKHPEVVRKGKGILLHDLMNDPVVAFQRRYYVPLAIGFCFVIPSLIPWYVVGESLLNAYLLSALRYCLTLHATWCVNSLAHKYGNKPYDKRIHPSENILTASFALGEGFHNYHHTFPHDYATSEYGMKLNLTTAFIDFMAFIGQAYDRRVISKEAIEARRRKTGELSGLSDAHW